MCLEAQTGKVRNRSGPEGARVAGERAAPRWLRIPSLMSWNPALAARTSCEERGFCLRVAHSQFVLKLVSESEVEASEPQTPLSA